MRGKEGKDSRINEICIVQGLIGRNLRRLSIKDNVVKKKKKTRLRDNLSNFSISLSLSPFPFSLFPSSWITVHGTRRGGDSAWLET